MRKTAKPYAQRRAFLLREFLFDNALRPSDPSLVERYARDCYSEAADTPERMASARVAIHRDVYRMTLDLDLVRLDMPVLTGVGWGRTAWAKQFALGPEGEKWLAFEG